MPNRSGYPVDIPSDGEGDAGTVRYTLSPNPYILDLIVEYVGSGAPPAEPYVCIQPTSELASPISPQAELPKCLFE